MPFKATGIKGEIRTGGRVAATLNKWELSGNVEDWLVRATPASKDEMLLRGAINNGCELRLEFGDRLWRYKDSRIVANGSQIVLIGKTKPMTSKIARSASNG